MNHGNIAKTCAVLTSAACAAGSVWAQPTAARADQAAEPSEITEVVVTARRREESLQTVPVAITAIDGKSLEKAGVRDGRDLIRVAPSLQVNVNNGNRNTIIFELRGVAAGDTLLPQDPGVAVYVNELVATRPQGLQAALYDLESVQVLYGAQGTLFGRNATAGAVLLTTRRPELNEIGGEARVTLGNYDRIELYGVLNLPLGENAAVRLAGISKKAEGYTHVVNQNYKADSTDNWSTRASLLWEPTDLLRTLFTADYYKADDTSSGRALVGARACGAIDPATLELTGIIRATGSAACTYPGIVAAVAEQAARGPRHTLMNVKPIARQKVWSVSNSTTYELNDAITLKNVIGYRNSWARTDSDLDGSAFPVLNTFLYMAARQFSEEFQVQGDFFEDQLNLIVGAYYFRETGSDAARSPAFDPPLASQTQATESALNLSKSLFAQGTFRPSGMPKLSVTGGLRYTWDKREVHATSYRTTGACLVTANGVTFLPNNACSLRVSKNFSEPSYTFSVDYQWTPDIMTYFATRRGYRSGGFNARGTTPAQLVPFRPEILTDYEVGVKSRFGPARLNVAAYLNKYRDLQRLQSAFINGTPTSTVINLGKATIKGGEAELTVNPVRGLEATLSGSITDFNIDRFDALVTQRLTATAPTSLVPATVRDVHGSNPKYTWMARISYTTELGDDFGELTSAFNYSWRSKGESPTPQPFYDAEGVIPSYGIANLSFRLNKIAGSRAYAGFFVENLFDKTAIINTISVQQTLGVTSALYTPPRMIGVELGVEF